MPRSIVACVVCALCVLSIATSGSTRVLAAELSQDERDAGFELLFDGETFDGWEQSGNWTIEGRSILTNFDSPLPILFVQRVEDENLMDSTFRDALSAYLAMEWAQTLTNQDSIEQSMGAKFQVKLAEARAANGQEGTPMVMEANEWDHARWVGSGLDGADNKDAGPYNF